MNKIPTPHINAKQGDIAKTVLMPGDPLRAKFIAENFLENPVQFNEVRGMLGFTGTYKGVPVSVMGSGMGCPSIGIYSYELFHFYGVENIMRVGTAGAISRDLHIGDIVLAQGACTNSSFVRQYNLPGDYAPIASFNLLEKAVEATRAKDLKLAVGNVLSSDTFYDDDQTAMERWDKMGLLCVEMEAAALYMNAARAGKNALAILTISDEIFTGKVTTALERQTAFTGMMEVALETAIK
ncbi:MAG: purine-nucleoside phosphorylase [Defluviitaleaceae bacterium]|nr:purine-nucleoside phosphorylase [Defluviitaleaceae bacterium]